MPSASQPAAPGYARTGGASSLQARLRRIEGQVRGLQRMLEEGRYCIDVLTQIDAVTAALARVQDQVLEAHLDHCVPAALESEDAADRQEKVEEIVELLRRFRRG